MSRPLFLARLLNGILFSAVFAGNLICNGVAIGATKESDQSSAEGLVKEALHRELYGLQTQRDQLLADAVRLAPDFGPAQWHRGFVREGGDWQSVDALIQQEDQTPAEKEYQLKRAELKDTIDGHLSLANWSRDRKLEQQERAHLSRVLDLNPEHSIARDRLGYVNVGGDWVTRLESRAQADRAAKEKAAEDRWRPTLLDVRRGILQDNPQRRQAAREKLGEISDPYAIPALESLLSTTCEEAALAVVDVLSRMTGPESVDSLIRHAVFSQWMLVREAAAERLRSRQRESFVPAMIGEMFSTTTSQFQVAALPNGRLGYRHVMQREGQEERQVLVLDTEYSRVRRIGGNGQETLFRAFRDSLAGVTQREVAVSQRNFLQLTMNQRLTEALNIATNQQLPTDPQRWWQWWDDENDVVRQGAKQTRQRQQYQQVSIADRRPQLPSSGMQSSGVGRQAECFAAGTQVLTRRGTFPIEKIQVGDLVLAQQVDTGEVAFKPVLRTTVRPAGKLVKLHVGRDTLETSRGHLYWVAGHGWSKAQRLDSGMQLHCLEGSQPISSIEAGTDAETYNLVVADFHTYFVGHERILSHDVTGRQPTDAIVPGLKYND